ncbi:GNAT family N-acetyltransferase [Romboutsia maritimum]|uniref:GNAT family N-acetyltransferase n=1 Tax=Romboutsia maritimum TaxID=2020948 RepID=A0A371IR18_9FIRM|nr:GNAT family N-acetyltransferase [Romboutsia maritimum]RDY22913.1 GNAT family N-acetyltransferase [Romboutsia maritimum]
MIINLTNTCLIKPISLEQSKEIKNLYELCSDYHIIYSGRKANEQDIKDIFTYTEDKTSKNSLTLGIYELNELIGLIDIFKNYPKENTWFIGLLLLSPNNRGNKLGSLVHSELVKYALGLDADFFRIGVLEENILAHKFWESLGYQKHKVATIKFENKEHLLDIYELDLTII